MGRVVAVVVAVATLAAYMSSNMGLAESSFKRSDDANNMAALEALLQQQAATINDLRARLDAQDTKNLEQTATIQSLRTSLSTQQNTIDMLQATIGSSNRMVDKIKHTVDNMNQTMNQTMDNFHQTLDSYDHALQTIRTTVETQGPEVGFHTDFGQKPYANVHVADGASVIFNRTLFNIGGGYDPSTGVFTTPVSGLYLFSLHFMGGSHSNSTNLATYVDGRQTLCVAFAMGVDRQENDQGSCTAVAQLQQGQGVSVKVYYGTPTIWGSILTSFSGVLVQSD